MLLNGLNVRAFVMVVQEFPEKTAFIRQHFSEVGVEAENFWCISGGLSGLYTVHPYEVDDPGSGWRMGYGPTANWLSQYMLWTAMSFMPEDYFFQLELDTQFAPDWKARTELALSQTPKDFDVLFVGSCCAAGKESSVQVRGDVWEVKYPMCNHAMIIAKKALPVMLSTQRRVYAKMDISLNFHTFPSLKVYTVLPRIAGQFNTFLHD